MTFAKPCPKADDLGTGDMGTVRSRRDVLPGQGACYCGVIARSTGGLPVKALVEGSGGSVLCGMTCVL
jgi:hypothetical protein